MCAVMWVRDMMAKKEEQWSVMGGWEGNQTEWNEWKKTKSKCLGEG